MYCRALPFWWIQWAFKTICIAIVASVLMIHCWLKCKANSCTGNKHNTFHTKNIYLTL